MNTVLSFNDPQLLSDSYETYIDSYYNRFWKDFSSRYHAHLHTEIMYVVKGSCTVRFDNTKIHLKKAEYVLINPSVYHQLTVGEEGCHIINLEFHFNQSSDNTITISRILKESKNIVNLQNDPQDYYLLKDPGNFICAALRSIIEFQILKEDNELLTQLVMSELLIKISQGIGVNKTTLHNDSYYYIKKVILFLESNYDKNLTIQEIADYISLHPSYLQRKFKESMNCTIFEYLCNLRIEKSKYFLEVTDLPITDIPSYIGMNSIQYYINLFHKKNGCTPLQYRKNKRVIHKNSEYRSSFLVR